MRHLTVRAVRHLSNQKQLYIDNLNTDIVEEDLNQLFGIRSIKYLQDTCSKCQ